MLLDKIAVSDIAPANTGVIWIKPVGDNYEQSIFLNGKWVKLDKAEEISGIVSSINNQTPDSNGNVNITKEHIGLEKVDNTADVDKVVKGASEDGSGNNIAATYETKTDATTKQTTLQGAINALQTSVAALTGLDSTNFGGFSIQSTEADAISNIATLYTADGYTNELLWYMAGTSLNSVKAYRYNGSGTPTAISSDSYNCVDFSGLIADVNTLRQDLEQLELQLYDVKNETKFLCRVDGANINTSTNKIVTSSGYSVFYAPVEEGDKIAIKSTYSSNKTFITGFTTVLPDANVDVVSVTSTSTASYNNTLTAPSDGYVVISGYTTYHTNKIVTIGGVVSVQSLSIDTANGVIISEAETQATYYIPTKAGYKYHITATNSEAKAFRYGFTTAVPAVDVQVLSAQYINSANVDINVTSEIDGYLVLSHASLYFADMTVSVYTPRLDRLVNDVNSTKTLLADIAFVKLNYSITNKKKIMGDGAVEDAKNESNILLSADVSSYIGKTLYLTGSLFASSGGNTYCWYTFLDSNGSVVEKSETSRATYTRFEEEPVVVPNGAKMLYVLGYGSTYPDAKVKVNDVLSILDKTIFIEPLMTFDIIRGTNGEFSTNSNIANANCCSSVRFIRVNGEFSVKSSASGTLYVFYYNGSFEYLGYTTETLTANTEASISLAYSNCVYIKLGIYADSGVMSKVTLTGNFDENWDVFNPRPVDNGYHRISVLVNVTNPTCSDNESSSVQDSRQLLADYGVICLPPTYKQEGESTRLIIYCHGAAVNYSDDATRFNTQDLEPEYWLAEGYAVMDIEGNPFDNENEHICIPQAMDCYVAGYKWAIEHYNLKRDGVFLGGRSMGGQNTFNLMRRECPIPVIAACPNSAAPDLSFGYSTKQRKEFCALHMGFVVPSGFTWSNGALTSNEIQVLKDNWDKYIKCCPELSACIDLPDKDTLLGNRTGEDKITLWSSLHMIAKCPVKLFGCNQDPSCSPAYTSALYYRMLINSGQMAELRLYDSNKDYSGTDTSAHHYDTQDPALRASVVTKYGEELTNIPIVYIEMLQFWRRYEQGM